MRTFIIGAAVLALLVGACASSGVNSGDVNLVSIQEEWELGAKLEADLAKKLTLVNDPTVVNYVSQMGQRIVQRTEMANLPWKFFVVRDESINAFNIPGGRVYVNTGLIAAAANASQLGGVLGHEIAHGVARHGTEQLTQTYGISLLAGVLLGENPQTYETILADIVGSGTIARFSRSAETEADILGVRFLYDAGYDPEGMVSMFQDLLSRNQRRQSSVERFFSTHPLTKARIRNVSAEIAKLPPKSGLIRDEAGFRQARARLR